MVTVVIENVVDLAGNANKEGFSWSFAVEEPACGRAEFLGDLASSQLVLNSANGFEGGVDVSIYNPDQSTQAWVDNLRIQSIALVYRSAQSASPWLEALDNQGNPVQFFDDVRPFILFVCTEFNFPWPA
jgi:hypothetical protein